jgi:Bacterial PH domain
MNPQAPPAGHDPHASISDDLKVPQPIRPSVFKIQRHPIGVISVYVISGSLIVITAIVVFGVLPALTSNRVISDIGVIVLFLLVIACSIYGLIFTKIYWGNTWTVTTEHITQITQTSLLSRRSSQLPLASIEDVTSEQTGPFSNLLNYGQISLETTNEYDTYSFTYCPNPNFYAREILTARDALRYDQSDYSAEPQHPFIEQLPPLPPIPEEPYQPPFADA